MYSFGKLDYRLQGHFTVINSNSTPGDFPYFIFLLERNGKLKTQFVDMTDVRAAILIRTTGV